jgi:hypothetical protein
MIDDKQTCDVCGEEFNEERPHHVHMEKPKQPMPPEGLANEEDAPEKA